MARNIDNLPIYDPIIKDKMYLSNEWASFLASFIETLQEYLSQNGMFVPVMTQAERDLIQEPVNGQMLFVSDLSELQIWKSNAWTVIV